MLRTEELVGRVVECVLAETDPELSIFYVVLVLTDSTTFRSACSPNAGGVLVRGEFPSTVRIARARAFETSHGEFRYMPFKATRVSLLCGERGLIQLHRFGDHRTHNDGMIWMDDFHQVKQDGEGFRRAYESVSDFRREPENPLLRPKWIDEVPFPHPYALQRLGRTNEGPDVKDI